MLSYIKNTIACILSSLILAFLALLLAGPLAAIISFFVGCIINIIVYYNSHRIIDTLYSPVIISPASAKELYVLLAQLAKKAQISLPILYASSSPQPNVLTISHKNNHKIIISKNLIPLLNRQELHAVLAHQVANIASKSIKHRSYIACISSLPSFFFFLGVFFHTFGGNPRNKPPAWAVTLFKPASWLAHFLSFICQSKKNIILIDTLAISIGANVNAYFKAISKISAASQRIKEPLALIFPSLSPLYAAPPIPLSRFSLGLPLPERLSLLTRALQSSGISIPRKSGKKTITPISLPKRQKKRPGVASGPPRSRP